MAIKDELLYVDEFTGNAKMNIPVFTSSCRGKKLGLELHYQTGMAAGRDCASPRQSQRFRSLAGISFSLNP